MATNTPNVSTPSSANMLMAPRLALIETVLGGTEAMREAGQSLLPRHAAETNEDYARRLNRSVFLNMTALVLSSLAGRVFREAPQLSENVPQEIKDLLPDVDLQGTHVWAFAQQWFKEALAKGLSHVLIDFQRPDPENPFLSTAQTTEATLDDDRRAGLRPYWVRVSPENVIAAHGSLVGGRWVLTHLRIRENQIVQEGFGERYVQRIRVITPTTWDIWELRKVGSKKEEWMVIETGVNTFGMIPLVTYYTGFTGLMEAYPPLLDLADLNVAHWQSASDQRNILTTARFPMLAVSGASAEDGDRLKVGPNQWLSTTDPQARWYYVEHTGAAIAAGASDLRDLETRMADFGAEFMKERGDNEGTIGRVLDSAESTSALASYANDFGRAMGQVLELTGRWLKLTGDMGEVHLKVHLGETSPNKVMLDTLGAARGRLDISRIAYLTELKARHVLSEEFDIETDHELLEAEISAEASRMSLTEDDAEDPPEDDPTDKSKSKEKKTDDDPSGD